MRISEAGNPTPAWTPTDPVTLMLGVTDRLAGFRKLCVAPLDPIASVQHSTSWRPGPLLLADIVALRELPPIAVDTRRLATYRPDGRGCHAWSGSALAFKPCPRWHCKYLFALLRTRSGTTRWHR